MGSNLGSGSYCRITSVLSTFNSTTEVRPLSKAPNSQLLPGCRCIDCPLLQVCVHGVCVHYCVCALGWVKCRAQILSMGHHTWPHVTSKFKFKIKFTEEFGHTAKKSMECCSDVCLSLGFSHLICFVSMAYHMT